MLYRPIKNPGEPNVILEPAWKKHLELQRKKNEELEAISIEEMIAQKRKAP
jgi:hypothetical protein